MTPPPTNAYSHNLLQQQGLNGTASVTAGPNEVLVIRDVDVYWGGGVSAGVSVRLIGAAGQTIWEVHVNPSTPPYDSQTWQWRGRQVIKPGESFQLVSNMPVDVTVSGYSLVSVGS